MEPYPPQPHRNQGTLRRAAGFLDLPVSVTGMPISRKEDYLAVLVVEEVQSRLVPVPLVPEILTV